MLAGCQLLSGGDALHTKEASGGAGTAGSGGAGGQEPCGPTNPNNYAETVLSDCPVAYWRLGESSCSGMCFARNEVTQGEQSVYQDQFTLGEPGALLPSDDNTAVRVWYDDDTEIGGYVDMLPTLPFPNGAPFSLEIWVRPDTAMFLGADRNGDPRCDAAGLLAHDGPYCNDGSPGYRLVLNSKCNFEFEMVECGTDEDLKLELRSDVISVSRWYHLAATFDDGMLLLYVDGEIVDSANPESVPMLIDGGYPLTLGGRGAGMWGLFTGWLDEAAIYDYALAEEQIDAHFAASGR